MRPKDNGLANLHDTTRKERGFCCMKLIVFLTEDGVTDWDEWHRAHTDAARGECKYRAQCPIYEQSKPATNENGTGQANNNRHKQDLSPKRK